MIKAAPVAVMPKPAPVIEAAVIVREVTDAAAPSVTPTALDTSSGTPSAADGVQVMGPEPASDSRTLPEPAPELRAMAAVGATDTVPAALPLSVPTVTEPPLVMRLRVEAELVTTLASEIAAVLHKA